MLLCLCLHKLALQALGCHDSPALSCLRLIELESKTLQWLTWVLSLTAMKHVLHKYSPVKVETATKPLV